MVSADRQSFESVRPILEVLGKPVIYVGEKPGMGQYMKLVNNLLSAAALAVTCEAMVLV
jgi:3-hydroxyisobutyrate dehydrogenase-like beta-hydroxyacid dehydrogenase